MKNKFPWENPFKGILPQKSIFLYVVLCLLEKVCKKIFYSMQKIFSNQKISHYHYLDFHMHLNQTRPPSFEKEISQAKNESENR